MIKRDKLQEDLQGISAKTILVKSNQKNRRNIDKMVRQPVRRSE